LAVAALNREFLIVSKLAKEGMAQAQTEGALAFDHLVARPLAGGPPGQNASADDVVEAAVDGVESWLFDALRAPVEGSPAPNVSIGVEL
jgi:hypothetical protein